MTSDFFSIRLAAWSGIADDFNPQNPDKLNICFLFF